MPHFIFIQQISVLNILNMLYNLHFFSLQNAVYFEKKKIRRQKVKLSSAFLEKFSVFLHCVHHIRSQVNSVHNIKACNFKKKLVIIMVTSDCIGYICSHIFKNNSFSCINISLSN